MVIAQGVVPQIASAQVIDPLLGPVVRIVSPPDHAVFYGPVDIPLFAYVRPEPGVETIFTNVSFYAGTNFLGDGIRLGETNILHPIYAAIATRPEPRLGSLYCFVWTNVPVGDYVLTAVASGYNILTPQAGGVMRTSPPVDISVRMAPTNATPDVVNIRAIDPVAIAGTNVSWVWQGMSNAAPAWAQWPPVRWQFFTNWGPKAALFLVHRFGDPLNPITVNYKIGGTASNGVDYAMLPGFLDIRAGAAYGLIPIVPIDSGISNVAPKTVILTLKASTNVPPDYAVGIPDHAAAVIFYKWIRPLPWMLPDRCFHISGAGPDGAWFSLETSADLLNWSSVCTNQAIQGSLDYVDPDAPGYSARYYRAIPLSSAPTP